MQKMLIIASGNFVQYSRILGKDDNFLCVYKRDRNRQYDKGLVTAEECYRDYLTRVQNETEALLKLQTICIYLSENRKIHDFGMHLCSKGIYGHDNTFASTVVNVFTVHNCLLSIKTVEKYQKVIKEFESLYGSIETIAKELSK